MKAAFILAGAFVFWVVTLVLLDKNNRKNLEAVKSWVTKRGGHNSKITQRMNGASKTYGYMVEWTDTDGEAHVVRYETTGIGRRSFREIS